MSDAQLDFHSIRKQVLGTQSKYLLLDQELCESRLYFASARFSALTADHAARMLFLSNLILFMMSEEQPEHREYAEKYALKTIQYGRYAVFRTHATDIYALSYAVLHPQGQEISFRDGERGRQYLASLNFDQQMSIEFLRRIAAGTQTSSLATNYLYRLETQLGIRDGRYRQWRRLASVWKQLRPTAKAKALSMMITEARRLGGGSGRNAELVRNGLNKLASKYINTPEKVEENTVVAETQPEPHSIKHIHQRWTRS